MSKYKLIALDMDGTLLSEEKLISDENKLWINKAIESGVTVCFSTGRGVQSAQPYVGELGLKSPIIAVNGSEVWKAPGNLHVRHLMEPGLIRELHKLAVKYDTWFWAYAVEGMFNKADWIGHVESAEWLKFGFHTEHNGDRKMILDTLSSWGTLEITNSDPNNLEINPVGISKASGLAEVCGLLGIEMSQVVAMGDSLNDVAMIRAAGLGIAMGNAQEEVKHAADKITGTNDLNGVAQAIRDYVLI